MEDSIAGTIALFLRYPICGVPEHPSTFQASIQNQVNGYCSIILRTAEDLHWERQLDTAFEIFTIPTWISPWRGVIYIVDACEEDSF